MQRLLPVFEMRNQKDVESGTFHFTLKKYRCFFKAFVFFIRSAAS